MCHDFAVSFGGGTRSDAAEYLGAEGDPWFPSPRRLRSIVANVADLLLILVAVAGVMWLLFGVFGLGSTVVMFGGYAAILFLAFAQYFLLPSIVGASVGQLICGLTTVRCGDAARPRIRDIARAIVRRPTMPFRIRGIHALAPHLVVVRRRDLIAYRADRATHPDQYATKQPSAPEYHGAEGDPRYPSPRDLRKAISTVADIVLIMVITPVAGAAVALHLDVDPELAAVIFFWTLMPLQLVALPAWIGSTLGQLGCGLAQIRGGDGMRPKFRDVIGMGNSLPADIRSRGDLYVTFIGLVVVRRRDLHSPAVTLPEVASGG
ncbi:RDD family protein [Nocardia amikacinitolerans]|uniref:RDD family protein n=1 Tax=Nocardia amikacinitolerans TaxID=756689 RepID=A0A285LQA4_9NOCA|nr:RDD family protein [Nocardia amikacinitolerans]